MCSCAFQSCDGVRCLYSLLVVHCIDSKDSEAFVFLSFPSVIFPTPPEVEAILVEALSGSVKRAGQSLT